MVTFFEDHTAYTYVTGSAKIRHNSAFFKFHFITFYNVHTQMHVLVKFQLRILKAFEVIALQSNSSRKINLYSKHRENKLQALPKMNVTYKWSEVGTRIFHHHICHELRNRLLGRLFLSLSCITTSKAKIHEETSIANDRFNVS